MHIAIVSGGRRPTDDAVPERLLAMAGALAAIGHRVTLTGRWEAALPAGYELPPEVVIRPLDSPPTDGAGTEALLAMVPAMADQLEHGWRADPPEVAHAIGLDAGLAVLVAARSVKNLFTVHERIAVLPDEGSLPASMAGSAHRLQSAVARSADAVVARSPEEARVLRRLGARHGRVMLLPQGVDTERFAPAGRHPPHEVAQLLCLDGGRSAASVGAAIRAAAEVPEAQLVVVGGRAGDTGPGAGAGAGTGAGSGSGADGEVRQVPEVPHEAVPALLRSSDILVTAPQTDPSGTVALEAMACAVPVVAGAVGALRSLVVDDVTGLLVPPDRPDLLAKAVRRLLDDPALRQALGVAGLDRARAEHSWPVVAGRLDRVYQGLHH
ncbi:glycosyltransferase [Kitasatospora sp. MBT63]|uniref:glycosyltransferase n=1 Tax=Kitasatospora sp. MBT63 TaxID=1444768 RepID=UPI00068BB9F9|nr:glycosyltransferase [Kitasatospora sp. MBT63]